jgi:hypothetical protein
MSATPEFSLDSIPYRGGRYEFAIFDELRSVKKPQGWTCRLCDTFVPKGHLHACPR